MRNGYIQQTSASVARPSAPIPSRSMVLWYRWHSNNNDSSFLKHCSMEATGWFSYKKTYLSAWCMALAISSQRGNVYHYTDPHDQWKPVKWAPWPMDGRGRHRQFCFCVSWSNIRMDQGQALILSSKIQSSPSGGEKNAPHFERTSWRYIYTMYNFRAEKLTFNLVVSQFI